MKIEMVEVAKAEYEKTTSLYNNLLEDLADLVSDAYKKMDKSDSLKSDYEDGKSTAYYRMATEVRVLLKEHGPHRIEELYH
jgi:hypothetical protein